MFNLSKAETNVKTEILAGVTTFMTMSYIIFVQPAVLSKCGMDFGAVMVATCIGSAIATALMAFLANYPIALAPAMGHNFYFVFAVCIGLGIPWQVALGANFLSGILFILLSFWGLRETLVNAVPASLKSAIAVGIGLLIAFIGLEWAGVIVAKPGTLVGLGQIAHPIVILSIFGFILIAILMSLNIKGAILYGIIATTVIGNLIGITRCEGIVSLPPSISPTFLRLNITGVFQNMHTMITVIFVLWFLDVFDTVGTLIGVGETGGFLKAGKLPRAKGALLSDAIGTVVGTLLGTSTITSYIESASGVTAGGRTGLANLVTAGLFILSLFFSPLIKMVATSYEISPGTYLYPAIAPALIIVGCLMMVNVKKIDWEDCTEALPSFLCIVIMAFSFSITEGIAFGFISYSLLKIVTKKAKKVHWMIYFFSFLFIIRYIILRG